MNRKGMPENLKPINSSEMAREYQKRSAEAQRKNKEERRQIAQHIKAMKELGEEAPTAEEALRSLLAKHLANEEHEAAAKVASTLMEYEKPKLTRQDITQKVIDYENLTDEELEELKKEAGL